jgi:hypothetical protein
VWMRACVCLPDVDFSNLVSNALPASHATPHWAESMSRSFRLASRVACVAASMALCWSALTAGGCFPSRPSSLASMASLAARRFAFRLSLARRLFTMTRSAFRLAARRLSLGSVTPFCSKRSRVFPFCASSSALRRLHGCLFVTRSCTMSCRSRAAEESVKQDATGCGCVHVSVYQT